MTDDRSRKPTRRVPNEPSTSERVPPHNLEAEAHLLGAAMLAPEALEVLVRDTRPEDFYKPSHAHIAAHLVRAFEEGWDPNPVTIYDELAREGLGDTISKNDLADIVSTAPTVTGAPRYATIVHDTATLRRLLGSAAEISEIAYGRADAHAAVTRAQQLVGDVVSQNGARNASTLEIADVGALLDTELEPEEADFLTRTDGGRLIYAGKMHVFQAEPSSGKTWIALLAALEVLNVGGSVIYLDYEDTAKGILGRLLALGAEPPQVRERFSYMQPAGAFGATERLELGKLLDNLNPDLVVIDGVAEALARDGLSEDRAAEVVGWIEKLPRWISRTGAAVVMLDHVVKDREQQGRWARGSSAKLAAVDGASYQVKVTSSFSRHKAGTMKLVVAKDRPGGVGAIGDVAAIASIAPKADGARVVVQLDPNTAEIAKSDPWKPTVLMEKVSRAVEDAAIPLTAARVKDVVRSEKPKLVTEAIARLIAEGWLVESTGKPKTLRVSKPYRSDETPPDPPEPPPELDLGLEEPEEPSNVVKGPWQHDPSDPRWDPGEF